MDLELIAGVVSERLSAAADADLKPEEPGDGFAGTSANDNSNPQPVDAARFCLLKSLAPPGYCTHPVGVVEESLDTRSPGRPTRPGERCNHPYHARNRGQSSVNRTFRTKAGRALGTARGWTW